jgi:hypothetical protein
MKGARTTPSDVVILAGAPSADETIAMWARSQRAWILYTFAMSV